MPRETIRFDVMLTMFHTYLLREKSNCFK
jgi:hypothetical protein